jgi:hypothetical protein
VLNISVHYRMYIFVFITCHSVLFYKTNSIFYRLINLVWIDRMYNKSNQIKSKHTKSLREPTRLTSHFAFSRPCKKSESSRRKHFFLPIANYLGELLNIYELSLLLEHEVTLLSTSYIAQTRRNAFQLNHVRCACLFCHLWTPLCTPTFHTTVMHTGNTRLS